MMTTGHREAENTAKQLRDAFGSRVHDDIAIPLGDIDYFRMQHTYPAKSSTNFLLDVIIKQNELIADLRTRARDIGYFGMQHACPTKSSTNFPPDIIFKQNELIADLSSKTPIACTTSSPKLAQDEVSHPDHYKMHNKECIVEMLILFGLDNFITFCQMNAWKYRYRAGNKANNSADQDNAKADRYIEYAQRARDIDYWNLSPSCLTDDECWHQTNDKTYRVE